MRYYFFETSEQMRDGQLKPTLRALPGQTFPDGTPVDTTLNIQAPKEPGTSKNGCRFEYPLGTIFGSTFLDIIKTSTGHAFYTVYDVNNNEGPGKTDPQFFPIMTSPSGQYVSKKHKNKKFEAAYVSFITFGDQTDGAEDAPANTTPSADQYAPVGTFHPMDKKGKAVKEYADWKPAYEDQVEIESDLIASWMRLILRENLINNMAKRPKVDAGNRPKFDKLYACGESAETIVSRARFTTIFNAQKMDPAGLSSIACGPLDWYLDELISEHERKADSTAVRRDPGAGGDVSDLSFVVAQEFNRQMATADDYKDPVVNDNLKKAIEAGWTIEDILIPEVLTSRSSLGALSDALASGAIPAPQRAGATSGTSYIDKLMSQKQNACPADKDGFHVDAGVWRRLVLNLNRRHSTLLVGPTGSGKTVLVQKLCEQTGTPFTIIPMGTITEPTDQLVGKMDLEAGAKGQETKFDWADFALAIQRPGVILLDEINRIPRNGYNLLFSVLDGTRKLPAYGAKGSDKRMIDVHPDCVFFATANIGSEYVGTDELDEAFLNRFRIIELDYLDWKTEAKILSVRTGINKEDADNIARIAKDIRSKWEGGSGDLRHAVSTRETIDCARYIADGFDIEEALEAAFLPRFERGRGENDPTSERAVVRAMIATHFNNTTTKSA